MHSLLTAFLLACAFCLLPAGLAGSVEAGNLKKTQTVHYSTESAPYFVVQLRADNGQFICSGALVSNEFVVTAAKCFHDVDFSKIIVVAGSKSLTEEGEQRHIGKVTSHPSANLAVLKLKEPLVIGDKVTLPSLCAGDVSVFAGVSVFGWRHMSNSHSSTDQIYDARLSIQECGADINPNGDDGLFCSPGHNTDNLYTVTDLGSPAVSKGQLCGVATSCTKCTEIDYTNSFVDTCHYHDFIKESMS